MVSLLFHRTYIPSLQGKKRAWSNGLYVLLRCSGDDFFLVVLIKVDKIVAVPCDADEKAAVFVRLLLRLAQCFRIDHVELDVMSSEFKVGPYELAHLLKSGVPAQNRWKESLIEQSAPRFELIHTTEGLDDRRRSVSVGAVGWRRPV